MDLIYTINRSKRRSLAIKISAGEVKVHAPKRCSQATIEAFLKQKEDWIRSHLQQQQNYLADLTVRRWQQGEQIHWLGKPLQLQVEANAGNKSEIGLDDADGNAAQLNVRLSSRVKNTPQHTQAKVKALVVGWFSAHAETWLQHYLAELAQTTPALAQPESIRIANYKAKWGACSKRGEVSFTWKLWLAPEWVVQYVVQHELAHLTHFNHSSEFWALVARVNPNYKAAEKWLRQQGFSVLSEQYLSYTPV